MQKWVKLILAYLCATTLLISYSIESKKNYRSRSGRSHRRSRRSHIKQRQKNQLRIPALTSEKPSLVAATALKLKSDVLSSELPANNDNDGISVYRPEDKEILTEIIQKNLSWLSRERNGLAETHTYSPEYMLTHMSLLPLYPDNSLCIFVYRKFGKPVSFITYRKNGNRSNIDFLAVDEHHRGRGYAEKLLKYATEYARQQGAHALEIYVFADNFAAQKLYDKLGFDRLPQMLKNYIVFEKKIPRE